MKICTKFFRDCLLHVIFQYLKEYSRGSQLIGNFQWIYEIYEQADGLRWKWKPIKDAESRYLLLYPFKYFRWSMAEKE